MTTNPYNLTILDQSPTLVYEPYRDGNDTTSGWKVFYSDISPSTYDWTHTKENAASGSSLHSTTMVGASVQLQFMGTAVSLTGSGTAGAYNTILDDGQAVTGSPNGENLVSYAGLRYGQHTVRLTVTQAQSLNITSAVVEAGIGLPGSTISRTTTTAVTLSGDGSTSLNPSFTTSGTGPPFSTDHDSTGYSRIDTNGAGEIITFKTTNASAIFVYGTCNYDHETYNVTLSPSAGASTSTRTFNATSLWFAYGNLLYWETGLNRSETYTVHFTNLVAKKYFDIHQVMVMDAIGGSSSGASPINPTPAKTEISTGAIAGIAVGAAVLLIAVVVALLWRRNRKQRQENIRLMPTPAGIYGKCTSRALYLWW
ncbi:hypothetical protein C8J56DRAFT_538310 [Mycena floridula]|nr:hypothetical protein C8J56DRAFT_538310 [Mycena floridula]